MLKNATYKKAATHAENQSNLKCWFTKKASQKQILKHETAQKKVYADYTLFDLL